MKKIRLVQMETVGGEKIYFIDIYREWFAGWKTIEFRTWKDHFAIRISEDDLHSYEDGETNKESAMMNYESLLNYLRHRNSKIKAHEEDKKNKKIRKDSMKIINEDFI